MLSIAVVGNGITGLPPAWLLSKRHSVTLFEVARAPARRPQSYGRRGRAMDAGLILYNDMTYPNLAALFRYLGVVTRRQPLPCAAPCRGSLRDRLRVPGQFNGAPA
jgi:uncharacterized protein